MTPEDIPAIEALLGITWDDSNTSAEQAHEDSGWARVEVFAPGGSSLGVVVRMSAGADWARVE